MPVSNMRKIGWAAVLIACTAIYAMLHLSVNAVKSEVRLAERQIVALERDAFRLETEFLTRASQRQLSEWNEVDFGYQAPEAGQFLGNERALALLGVPRTAGAPEPIRVATTPQAEAEESALIAMVSPLTGRAMAAEADENASDMVGAQQASLAGQFHAVDNTAKPVRPSKGTIRIALSGLSE
jgi:hypothetical protein